MDTPTFVDPQEYILLARKWRVGAASLSEVQRLLQLTGPDSLLGAILTLELEDSASK